MPENRTDMLAALFSSAGAAHHIYERDVLNGVYHEDWFGWYAEYVVEHGIGTLLGHDVTVEEMTVFFQQVSAAHKANEAKGSDGSSEAWTTYYARALANAEKK